MLPVKKVFRLVVLLLLHVFSYSTVQRMANKHFPGNFLPFDSFAETVFVFQQTRIDVSGIDNLAGSCTLSKDCSKYPLNSNHIQLTVIILCQY